jgi:putative membrane protein
MQLVALGLLLLIAVEHLWFLVLEMFLFVTPTGLETFHMSQAMANTCAVLAKNQGLYNGFLAAALLLAAVTRSALMRRYGLGCVVVAGLYGSWSLGSKDIALVQGLPAAIALVLAELADLAGRARQSRN